MREMREGKGEGRKRMPLKITNTERRKGEQKISRDIGRKELMSEM